MEVTPGNVHPKNHEKNPHQRKIRKKKKKKKEKEEVTTTKTNPHGKNKKQPGQK